MHRLGYVVHVRRLAGGAMGGTPEDDPLRFLGRPKGRAVGTFDRLLDGACGDGCTEEADVLKGFGAFAKV